MRSKTYKEGRPDADPGQVRAQRLDERWIGCDIGRSKYTKRFNLTDDEARELATRLLELVGQ